METELLVQCSSITRFKTYSQLYIIEGDRAVEERMRQKENVNCRRDIMISLTGILKWINPYAAACLRIKPHSAEYGIIGS